MGVYTDTYSVAEKVELLPWIVEGIAEKRHLSQSQAFSLLKECGALQFYDQFYGILHTFSIEDAVDSLDEFCRTHTV